MPKPSGVRRLISSGGLLIAALILLIPACALPARETLPAASHNFYLSAEQEDDENTLTHKTQITDLYKA